MEGREAAERFERTEELAESRERFGRRAAVLVSALAALLALATLAGNRAAESTLLDQQKASDAYNEAQANSLKRHGNEDAAQILRLLSIGTPKQHAAAAAAAQKLDQKVKEKYRPREDELLAKARHLEHERDRAEIRHRGYQLAEAAFQLAIVLISIAIIARLRLLILVGLVLGLVGIAVLVDSYKLIWLLPLGHHGG